MQGFLLAFFLPYPPISLSENRRKKGRTNARLPSFFSHFLKYLTLGKTPGIYAGFASLLLIVLRVHRKNLRQIIPYYPVFSLAFGQENLSLLSFLFLLCYLNFEDTIHEPNNSCTRVLLFLFIPFLFLFSLYLKGRNQEGKVLSERTLRRCKQ